MLFSKNKTITQLTKEVDSAERRWNKEKVLLARYIAIHNERKDIMGSKKKPLSTSKFLILFLFINCTIIEIFTMYSIARMLEIVASIGISMDFSPLVTLIGTVVTETIGYAVYAIKSTKENTKNGIVYETAMHRLENGIEETEEDAQG